MIKPLNFSRAIRACGTAGFPSAMLADIAAFLRVEKCGIVEYSKITQPHYIHSDLVPKEETRFYLEGTYRFDPFFYQWRNGGRSGVLTLDRIRNQGGSEALGATDYILQLQPITGMADELALLLNKIGFAVDNYFFLRDHQFTVEEITTIEQATPMLQALYDLNQNLMLRDICAGGRPQTPVSNADAYALFDREGQQVFVSDDWAALLTTLPGLVETLGTPVRPVSEVLSYDRYTVLSEPLGADFSPCPDGTITFITSQPAPALAPISALVLEELFAEKLTDREIDICLLILKGYPSTSISEKLGITVGTVKNHRKNIYRKLDITSERELFLMLIGHVSNQ